MPRPVVISLSLAGVFFAIVLWLVLGGDPGSGALDESRDPIADDAEPDLVPLPLSKSTASDRESDDEDDGSSEVSPGAASRDEIGAALFGTVVDDRGRGIAGAVVVVRVGGGSVFSMFRGGGGDLTVLRERALGRGGVLRDQVVARTRTGDDGGYAIALSKIPRGQGTYAVLASARGKSPETAEWQRSPESSRVDFELPPGNVITGVVVSPGGEPVAGAFVAAERSGSGGSSGFSRRGPGGGDEEDFAGEAETDSKGRFELFVGDATYDLEATATGFARGDADDVASGSSDVVVALSPARNLEVVVNGPDGKPVAGAEAALFPRSRMDEFLRPSAVQRRVLSTPVALGKADASGRALLASLSSGSYRVVVERDGFRTEERGVDIEDEVTTSTVTVELARGRRIEGRVVDPKGRPVAGAFVVAGQSTERGGGFGFGGGRGRGRGRESNEERLERLITEGRVDEAKELEDRMQLEAERETREPIALVGFRSSTRATRAAESDAAGRFRIDTLEEGVFSLSVEKDGFVPYREEGVDVTDGDQEVSVSLDSGSLFRARVVSSTDGESVPGATIRLSREFRESRSGKSDGVGNVEIGGFVPGDEWTAVVSAEGFSVRYLSDLTTGESEQTIELDPAAFIAGVVVDSSGQPIEGARVRVSEYRDPDERRGGERRGEERGGRRGGGGGEDFRSRMNEMIRRRVQSVSNTTKLDGSFRLENVSPESAVALRVSHQDYKEYTGEPIQLAPGEAHDSVEITLATGARLLVRMTDSDGAPVSGEVVTIRRRVAEGEEPAEENEFGFRRGGGPRGRGGRGGRDGGDEDRFGDRIRRQTGADGTVLFAGVDGGDYAIYAEVDRHQPFQSSVQLAEEKTVDYDMRLLEENWIAGIVTDSNGELVSEAEIRVTAVEPDPSTGRRHDERGETDESGQFRVGELGAGPYAVRAEKRGYVSHTIESVEVNSETRHTLALRASITGWVVSATTGSPIEVFEMRLSPKTSSNGTGESPASATDEETSGRRGRGEGRGRRGGEGGGRSVARGSNRRERFRDPDGAFEIEGVRPSTYTLEVSAAGFVGTRVDVVVSEGQPVEGLQIRLLEGLALQGIVIDRRSGAPLPGAEIHVIAEAVNATQGDDPDGEDERRSVEGRRRGRDRGREGRRSGTASTEEAQLAVATYASLQGRPAALRSGNDGSFETADVEPGRYVLLVAHDAYVPYREEIELFENRGVFPAEVALDEGSTLRGRIRFGRRESAAGATVVLEAAGGYEKRATVNDQGRYSMSGLLPGTYSLRVVQDGQSLASGLSVSVKRGTTDFDHQVEE